MNKIDSIIKQLKGKWLDNCECTDITVKRLWIEGRTVEEFFNDLRSSLEVVERQTREEDILRIKSLITSVLDPSDPTGWGEEYTASHELTVITWNRALNRAIESLSNKTETEKGLEK